MDYKLVYQEFKLKQLRELVSDLEHGLETPNIVLSEVIDKELHGQFYKGLPDQP